MERESDGLGLDKGAPNGNTKDDCPSNSEGFDIKYYTPYVGPL